MKELIVLAILTSSLAHEKRVLREAFELGTKINSLRVFLEDDRAKNFIMVSQEEFDLLTYQEIKMTEYYNLLQKRIRLFKDAKPLSEENMTVGERAVGISFNPSGNKKVNDTKQMFADIIDLHQVESLFPTRLEAILSTNALVSCVNAQMASVKTLTFKL